VRHFCVNRRGISIEPPSPPLIVLGKSVCSDVVLAMRFNKSAALDGAQETT
jgi:hypothetical protein